jgi:hypothetical protein
MRLPLGSSLDKDWIALADEFDFFSGERIAARPSTTQGVAAAFFDLVVSGCLSVVLRGFDFVVNINIWT